MQAQLVIDEYLEKCKDRIQDELVRDGVMEDGEPFVPMIQKCAQLDALQLKKLLGAENVESLHQIVCRARCHSNTCMVMYWVTFYLNATCDGYESWAHRCFVNKKVFAIYCDKLKDALGDF